MAREMMNKDGNEFDFVTIGGDKLDRRGAMRGGFSDDNNSRLKNFFE